MAHRAPQVETNTDNIELTPELKAALKNTVAELQKQGGIYAITQDMVTNFARTLTGALINAALQGEMDYHLTTEAKAISGEGSQEQPENKRNGYSKKTIRNKQGELEIQIPRDRNGTYTPGLIPKYSRRFEGFDDLIIDLYARGMTTREIGTHLADLYGVQVSPEFISTVTDKVYEVLREWKTRALDEIYPVVFFDALRVNIRKDGRIQKESVYLALGVRRDGTRDVLGMWVSENEGAAFWTSVFVDLQTRGVKDILIAVTDGLKGMTKAIETVFPKTQHQTCIIHLIRSSTAFVSLKDMPKIMSHLKAIYRASSEAEALTALDAFEASDIGKRYKLVVKSWRTAWAQVVPFFAFPPAIRKLIYTSNSIEALNRGVRKVIKTHSMFPSEDAAQKLIYLALDRITKKWSRPVRAWSDAMPVFATMFEGRFAPA